MAPHTGGTVYSWELCGTADRVTQDCQCATCAPVREELTPEELATLPFDATSTEEASTMITVDNIGQYSTLFVHITDQRRDAKPAATRVVSIRRNGATKTWKTRPGQFRAPFTYGLRDCLYVTQDNAHRYHPTEEEAAQSPAGRYIDC